jgi:sensor histidine kinase YesM
MPALLTSRRVLGPFLVAWIPLAAMIAVVLRLAQATPWAQSLALAIPAAAAIAFLCAAAAYPARGIAAGGVSTSRLLTAHLTGAVVATSLWLGMLRLWVEVLAQFRSIAPIRDAFPRHVPVLAGFGLLVYLLAVAFHSLIAALEQSRRSERRALESELSARDAEVKMLRAQVDPHFLFNSLNAVAGLTHSEPDLARALCLRLGEFLRAGLRIGNRSRIRFDEELALARDYMGIEQIRFGERLRYEERIGEDCAGRLVPPLILQPLLENAVRHGIAGLVGSGEVLVTARGEEGRMLITVENTRDPDAAPGRRGEGMGLANVRRRLRTLYAGAGSLTAEPAGDRFLVTIAIPAGATGDSP